MDKLTDFDSLPAEQLTDEAILYAVQSGEDYQLSVGTLKTAFSSTISTGVGQWAPSVEDLNALRAVPAADRTDGQTRLVQALQQDWGFESSSTAPEAANVVRPSDISAAAPGRWLLRSVATQNHESLVGLQGGAEGDHYHLTATELSRIPSPGQKAALAGTGTPGSGNKYVTADTLATETTARIDADALAFKKQNLNRGVRLFGGRYPETGTSWSQDGWFVEWKNFDLSPDPAEPSPHLTEAGDQANSVDTVEWVKTDTNRNIPDGGFSWAGIGNDGIRRVMMFIRDRGILRLPQNGIMIGDGSPFLDDAGNPRATIPLFSVFVSGTYGDGAPGFRWNALTENIEYSHDGTIWGVPGNVIGPALSTDRAIALFDGTTGHKLRNSPVTVAAEGALGLPEIATPTTPATGRLFLYAKANKKLYLKDSTGTETEVGSGASGGQTPLAQAPTPAGDGIYVDGCGDENYIGYYQPTDSVYVGATLFRLGEAEGPATRYCYFMPDNRYYLSTGIDAADLTQRAYRSPATATTTFIPETGWEIVNGTAPAPTIETTVGALPGNAGSVTALDKSHLNQFTAAGALHLPEITAPAAPAAGKVTIYAKSDGHLYAKNHAGDEVDLSASNGSDASGIAITGAQVKRTTGQTIPHATITAIEFDDETFDTGSYFSLSTPTRLTISQTGYYQINGVVGWAPAGGSVRSIWIRKNGTGYFAPDKHSPVGSGNQTTSQTSPLLKLEAGDHIELMAYQDSGSDLEAQAGIENTPFLSIYRISSESAGHEFVLRTPDELSDLQLWLRRGTATSGAWTDAKNGHDAALSGGLLDAEGAQFDGSTNYAQGSAASLPSGTTARTLFASFRINALPNTGNSAVLFFYGATSTDHAQGIGLGDAGDGTQYINFFGWGDDFQITTPLYVGQFYTLAGTFDGTTAKLYLNGVLAGTSNRPLWNTTAGGNYQLGRLPTDASHFNGTIAEMLVYSRNLTPSEVAALHAMTLTAGITGDSPSFLGARVYSTIAQTIPHDTVTALEFDAANYDANGLWNASTNPSRLTISQNGHYRVTGHIRYTQNGTGARYVWLQKNGGGEGAAFAVHSQPAVTDASTYMSVSGSFEFVAGDYVELIAYQRSGGDLDIICDTETSPALSIERLGATANSTGAGNSTLQVDATAQSSPLNLTPDQSAHTALIFTGARTAPLDIIPPTPTALILKNGTTGGHPLQFRPSLSSPKIAIGPAETWQLFTDGTDVWGKKLDLAALSPSDISGQFLWLKADSLGLLDGTDVETWNDSSGNNNHATQSDTYSQPTYVANVLNGKPAVRFNGSNQYLAIPHNSSLSLTGDFTMFIVYKTNNDAAIIAKRDSDSTSNWELMTGGAGNIHALRFATVNNGIGRDYNSTLDESGYALFSLTHDDDISELRFYRSGIADGFNPFSTIEELAADSSPLYIGCQFTGTGVNSPLNGDILEFIGYNRLLTNTERQGVESYLSVKYEL